MHVVINSARLYFWPIIAANVTAMTIAIGADPIRVADHLKTSFSELQPG